MRVPVETIFSDQHAQDVALNWLADHPDYEWLGHWEKLGEISVLYVKYIKKNPDC
jgi:hypothetical protein